MPEIVVFPNVLPAVIGYLDAHLDSGVTVAASLPPDTPVRSVVPFVMVLPGGGGWIVRKQLDEVVLLINIYHHAEQLSALDNLGQQVRAVIESMQGQTISSVKITRTTEQSGLSRLPDSDPLIARAGITVALLVRP